MKKIITTLLITFITFFFFTSFVSSQGSSEKGKAHAPDLEKIEFIHYKKGFAKPASKPGKPPKTTSCYKFLSGKLKWKSLPVSYTINPENPQDLTQEFIESAVSTSAEVWDQAVRKELMRNEYFTGNVNYGVQDYQNAITFGNYPDSNVIAVTSIWYNPASRSIVEFDVLFDIDFIWGDASSDSIKMDLQNIATHELGHGIGLSDVYETGCSEVTMYGYSIEGETKKRILEAPDIKGIQTLYP